MDDRVQTFIIISCIALAIIYIGSAIGKLVVHSKFSEGGCPIEEKLDNYLFYGGLVDIGWIILCIISPCFGFDPTTYIVKKETIQNGRTIHTEVKEEERAGCGTLMLVAAFGCLIASFVFSCLGNVWILNKYDHVEYRNETSVDYCYPPLFKGAFGLVIITDIWYAFFLFIIILLCIFKQ